VAITLGKLEGQTDDAAAVRPMMASVPSEAESADTTGHGMCWMPSSRQMSAYEVDAAGGGAGSTASGTTVGALPGV
jgi:hypothetical protein